MQKTFGWDHTSHLVANLHESFISYALAKGRKRSNFKYQREPVPEIKLTADNSMPVERLHSIWGIKPDQKPR